MSQSWILRICVGHGRMQDQAQSCLQDVAISELTGTGIITQKERRKRSCIGMGRAGEPDILCRASRTVFIIRFSSC